MIDTQNDVKGGETRRFTSQTSGSWSSYYSRVIEWSWQFPHSFHLVMPVASAARVTPLGPIQAGCE